TVTGQGRIISINDRFKLDTADVTTTQGSGGCPTYPSQFINYGGVGQDLGNWSTGAVPPQLDTSHMPEVSFAAYMLTGEYGYYQQLMMQAAHAIGATGGNQACTGPPGQRGPRQGAVGIANIEDGDRTADWNMRE